MNILTFIMDAQPAAAQGTGQGGFWITMILLFAIMYFFMIRPQRKQQKELEKFRSELKKGDKVITVGGIYGIIGEIEEKTVLLRVDGDVKLRVDKASIVRDSSDAQSAQQSK